MRPRAAGDTPKGPDEDLFLRSKVFYDKLEEITFELQEKGYFDPDRLSVLDASTSRLMEVGFPLYIERYESRPQSCPLGPQIRGIYEA